MANDYTLSNVGDETMGVSITVRHGAGTRIGTLVITEGGVRGICYVDNVGSSIMTKSYYTGHQDIQDHIDALVKLKRNFAIALEARNDT